MLTLTDETAVLSLFTEPITFPSIHEVRQKISSYAGPLEYAPKWNYAHFILDPDDITSPVEADDYVIIPPFAQTMYEFEQIHNLKVRSAPTFATGQLLPI